jgi:hypothetical protein
MAENATIVAAVSPAQASVQTIPMAFPTFPELLEAFGAAISVNASEGNVEEPESSPHFLLTTLLNSTEHIDIVFCPYLDIFSSVHATYHNSTFHSDTSCEKIMTEAKIQRTQNHIIKKNKNAKNESSTVDSGLATMLMPNLMDIVNNPEKYDDDASAEYQRMLEGDARVATSSHSPDADSDFTSFLEVSHAVSSCNFKQ